ncbi:MAG: ATP-binding protein, partial [Tannerella sp.]|nr:ATP-binding protein [Tannerella sp.]
DGLYIQDKWDWTQQYPVIRLDFGGLAFNTPEELEQSLTAFINSIAEQYRLSLSNAPYAYRFRETVEKLHQSTGQQVVVLVDEYDKPITDHLSNPETREANRNILHSFYQVLKAVDEHIRLIFLTGVSKFSGVSVFSALNNPDDITLNPEYSTICGYTQEELESYFPERIDSVARRYNKSREEMLDAIRMWYDGYSWDGRTSVYNPFSTLLLFGNGEIGNYWFRTGTPTFLMELLKKRDNIAPVLTPIIANSSIFEGYDPANIGEISLLFQTGYLTVKKKDFSFMPTQYTLGIPNEEVRTSFLEYLLNAYSAYPVGLVRPLISDMQQHIHAGDTEGLEKNLRLLLANIPSTLHIKREAYYHSMFLTWMKLLGFDIQGEVITNVGRIDAVWQQSELTVVAEIKYSAGKVKADSLLNAAMEQIHDRRYYEKYLDRKVILMAVAFTGKEVRCMLDPQ